MKKTRYTKKTETEVRGRLYESSEIRVVAVIRDLALGVIASLALLSSIYIVGEGERGVVTRFGEAIYQSGPGLQFKLPFTDAVRKIEIRERKSVEDLAAATKNQLPTTATVSINWTADAEAVMDIYRRYGSLEQFQERILDPKLREAAKASIARFNADELIRDRQTATGEILTTLTDLMDGYPVSVNSPQIENIALPPAYLESVMAKERAREDASREQYNLEPQKLEALRAVQTAEAERDAAKALADGNAYKLRTEAEAEADAIRLRKNAEADGIKVVESALSQNSLFVDYTKARAWNGQMPQTMLGNSTGTLINLK